jgi:hypothetical protein
MALLAPETLHFGHRNTLDIELGKGLADLVELEGFDNGGDHFHAIASSESF